jgi:serine/threonine protein kinase
VHRQIGSGRLGPIFEASRGAEPADDDRVALQLIDRRIAAASDSAQALRRGIAAVRAGPHPNIVNILDFESSGESPVLILELLEGASMRFVLDDAGNLPFAEAAPILNGVGRALKYLHAKGMVHGNLRPSQVFATDELEIKLLDIVPMMPPVRLPSATESTETDDDPPDMRDDVFNLASLAYELLTGHHPFNSNSPADALHAGLTVDPIPGLRERASRALVRGLALERVHRTATVAKFLEEFGILGDERLRPRANSTPVAPMLPEPEFTPLRAPLLTQREEPQRSGSASWLVAFVLIATAGLAWMLRDELPEAVAQLAATIGLTAAPPVQNLASSTMPAEETAPAPLQTPPDSRPAAIPGIVGETPAAETEAAASLPVAITPLVDPQLEVRAENESAATATTASVEAHVVAEPERERITAREPEQRTAVVPERVPVPAAESAQAATREEGAPTEVPEPEAPPVPVPPAFEVAQTVLAVNERQAAARFDIRRTGDSSVPASFVWWVSSDTARADDDFVAAGEQTEQLEAGEIARSIFVPLIDAGRREPAERFYFYIGRLDAASGRIETTGSVQVEITDDD